MFVRKFTAVLFVILSLLLLGEGADTGMIASDLPSCFEVSAAYIGYPMNIPQSGGRYLQNCTNPEDCQLMCQEAAGCEWFNWSNFTSTMTGNQITRCWMKTGKGNAKEMPGVITGPKYCKPQRSCIERGKMYIGDELNRLGARMFIGNGEGLNRWVRWKNNFGRQKTEADCQVCVGCSNL